MVIVAAALTVAVAAALATALVTFSGQALPRAVRHDLNRATGTSLVIVGNVNASQGAQYTAMLPAKISAALEGTPFAFYHGYWSDPLGFAPGAKPAPPAGTGTVQIAEAAALDAVTAHAVLVSGHWPGGPVNGPIPAALPASAAALLHVTTGDVLQMRDRLSGHPIRFVVTGLYRPRQVSSPYWGLDDIGLGGSSTLSRFTTYGPLAVAPSAFAGPLAVNGGSWLAVPQTASVPADQLRTAAANVVGLRQALADAVQLPDLTLTTGLPSVLDGTASNLDVARSLLAICAVLLALLAAAALLVGASGSGKSTLMNILAGLDTPTAGSVRVAGNDLSAMSARQRLAYRRQVVGFVWQQTSRNLLPYLTAQQNVELPMRLAGGRAGPRRARSAELLDLLGLGDCLHRRPDQMSGGEQQRAAIAVALVNEPKVLLADEPTGELDTATAAEVFGALQRANTELGVTVLIVTHDPAVSSVVRRVVAIRDGRTSTETHRHATTGDDGEVAQHAVEYAVLDRAGRLQLPREMTEPLGLRDLVRLEAEPDHIGVWPDRRDPGDGQ